MIRPGRWVLADPGKIRLSVRWYSVKRPTYATLALKVESILRDVLEKRSVNFYSLSSRAKKIDSYKRKASEDKYGNPKSEIMDMAGVRVITYTQSDANKVGDIVKELFDIIPEHSVDKTEELGVDRVGYRSIHFVGTLGERRRRLPENLTFGTMRFEIQVRTILQHAWAEFEHDRNYQFAGVLPREIKRRVSILSGNLELIDREFDNVAHEVERYAASIEKRTESGDLGVPIDSTSLKAYLKRKFASLIQRGLDPTFNRKDEELVEELRDLGITKLDELDKAIPLKLEEKFPKHITKWNFAGLLRVIMIILNPDLYFDKSWKRHWFNTEKEEMELLWKFGINYRKYAQQHKLVVS